MPITSHDVVATIDASFGRLQGCSGQDMNHGHSHLMAFGGNDTRGPIEVATARNACASASGRMDFESETFLTVAHSLRAEGFDASEDGTGRGTPLVPVAYAATDYESGAFDRVESAGPLTTSADRTRAAPILAFSAKDHGGDAMDDCSPTLRAGGHSGSHANAGVMPAVAFHENQRGELSLNETAGTVKCAGGKPGQGYPALLSAMQVRRLTPRECERLQGFPDDYTLIPLHNKKPSDVLRFSADGPRYKALGNSWAVPVARWVGERIAAVEAL